MYELIQVAPNTYYIDCPAKVGIVTEGQSAYLIDSSSDKDAGKKVLRHLQANGWSLQAVYCTHSHADHIGGCKYLQDQTGCAVYAPGVESAFTAWPLLEPSLLYGGNPPAALRNKFLMAQPCRVQPLSADALPACLSVIPLPGHSLEMVAYRTAEEIVFLADSLASAETLAKYGIGYTADIAAYFASLEQVKSLQAKLFVPAHAPAAADIAPLAQLNIDAVHRTAAIILSLCTAPTGMDALLKGVFEAYGLTMTHQQHALIGSTVRSYLTWLEAEGRVTCDILDSTMVWQRTVN